MSPSGRTRWGAHLVLLALSALPLAGFGVWLISTARGSLPQVQVLFGVVALGVALLDLTLTTVVASRVGTTLPRLVVIHALGLVSTAAATLAALALVNS
jgi:hypothetical protein